VMGRLHPGYMVSREGSAAADAAARVRAWAQRLYELGRPQDALRVLREAVDQPGDAVELALALAEADDRAGQSAEATELLYKVLRDDPGNVRAVSMLAWMLLLAGKADEAARMVEEAGDSGELAELAGRICVVRGRHAEAVAVFGSPAALSAGGRKLRRRAWWRSGGPFRRRRSLRKAVSSTGGAAAPPDPSDVVLELITWVKWLSGQSRHDEAREVISVALTEHGRQPDLLACSAEVEAAAHARNTALSLWREVYCDAPDDPDVVCGMATCLAGILVVPSYTYRISDALRVLAAYPDQHHPKIRATRAEILSYLAPRAAVVEAFGPAGDLPAGAAHERRRLWWRSAGPLGQLRLAIAERIRGEPQSLRGTDLVQRTEAESEAVARLLDSADAAPPAVARGRIEEGMRQHGRLPSLLLAYADIDLSEGADWHRLALATEAARLSPASVDTVCAVAQACYATLGYGTALQVLESLAAPARQTVEARVVAANLHRLSGNFGLAVKAYGDPRDLDRDERKKRRGCIRKGLRQRVGSAGRDDVSAIDVSTFDPVPEAVALVIDQGVVLHNDPVRLRELITTALAEHGRHPMLLLRLADVEDDHGSQHACAALAAEALRAADEDPLIVSGSIRSLWATDYDADALRAIADLSDQLRDSLAVREAAAEVYASWRLNAHALAALGRSGLDSGTWTLRRNCWRRTGGPIRPIRSAITSREIALLSDLGLSARQVTGLAVLALPADAADTVRGELSTHRMARAYWTTFRPQILWDWLDRILSPLSAVILFVVLILAERLRTPAAAITRDLVAAAIAVVAAMAVIWLLHARTKRWRTSLGIAGASGTVAAFLVPDRGQAAFSAGLAFSLIGFWILSNYVLWHAFGFSWRVRTARMLRAQAENDVLSGLLGLLGLPQPRGDADRRRNWMADLEKVAHSIERDLPYALRSGDPESQRTITAHVQSAAVTLREMKPAIALPDEASWHSLIEQLTGLAGALARHDFQSWPAPLATMTESRPAFPPWRKALNATRNVLVIFVPPLGAYLLPLVVPVSGPGLSWLRFASIVWALLGIVIAIDPAWTERVTKMRQGIDLLRSASPPKNADSAPNPYATTDAAPSQAADSPQWTPDSPRWTTRPQRPRTAPTRRR
jgi:tetratricopeptide (TPR) repeat protein